VGECQVDQSKNAYTKNIAGAQTTLLKTVTAACITPGVSSNTVGLGNMTNCPGAAAAAAIPNDALAFQQVVKCIEESVNGDFVTGNVVDTNLQALQSATGTGGLPPNNKFNHSPRLLLQLANTQLLQLGTAAPTNNGLSVGGNITPINLAKCQTNNGPCTGGLTCTVGGAPCATDADCFVPNGNGNGSCVNDVDCGTNNAGVAGHCLNNPVVGGEMKITGAPVFNPANPNSLGPTLTVSPSCNGSTAACLVTHTTNSGNGTTTDGSIDLLSGHYTASSPISTDVYVVSITADCSTFQPCPVCNASTKTCSAAPFGPCSAGDQAVTVECRPGGSPAGTVPNPFLLSNDIKTMVASAPGNKYCGYCDSNAAAGCQGGATMCSHGCQTFNTGGTQNCNGVAGATVCDFGDTAAGFYGDSGTPSISGPGIINQYLPTVSGIFCSGIAGTSPTAALVNASAGLPSPVRVIVPYALSFVEPSN